jgi:translation initiation factor IF-2
MNDEQLLSLTEVVEQPALPEAELNVEAPADKEPIARDESGKFAAKEPAKEPAKVEPKEEPKLEAPKEQPKQEPRTIPLAAHLEERKALKAQLDAMQAELAALKNPPKPPAPEPEYNADPKAYTDHKVQSVLQQLEQVKGETTKQLETTQQTAAQAAEQAQQQQFLQAISAAESDFVKTQPDYFDAVQHIRQVRLQQIQMFNPEVTQEQAAQIIRNEEIGMAVQLARSGRNPITTAYQLAKAYGYQPKQAKAAEPALELPKVPTPKQLPPDQTLGTGAAAGDVTDDQPDPFEQAFGEMFKPRKSA